MASTCRWMCPRPGRGAELGQEEAAKWFGERPTGEGGGAAGSGTASPAASGDGLLCTSTSSILHSLVLTPHAGAATEASLALGSSCLVSMGVRGTVAGHLGGPDPHPTHESTGGTLMQRGQKEDSRRLPQMQGLTHSTGCPPRTQQLSAQNLIFETKRSQENFKS